MCVDISGWIVTVVLVPSSMLKRASNQKVTIITQSWKWLDGLVFFQNTDVVLGLTHKLHRKKHNHDHASACGDPIKTFHLENETRDRTTATFLELWKGKLWAMISWWWWCPECTDVKGKTICTRTDTDTATINQTLPRVCIWKSSVTYHLGAVCFSI